MHFSCRTLAQKLDRELRTAQIQDSSLNGLQVDGTRSVRKVAVAVDACVDAFQAAVAAKADLLIVHHGLFWGTQEKMVGRIYRRIQLLIQNGTGLYASHLPLDLHPRLGNNALIAKGLRLQQLKPFGMYHQVLIGYGGTFSAPVPLQGVADKMKSITGLEPKVLAFGNKQAHKVAIISGGGGDLLEEAVQTGYDTFITGEISHSLFHVAKENHMNVFICGHYATETLGVRALGEFLKKNVGIKSVFIDLPTGL